MSDSYSLRFFGDPALKVPAESVTIDTIDIYLISALRALMQMYRGVGMAAQQVGGTQRVCVATIDGERWPKTFINPVIVESSEEATLHVGEGCLSAPGFRTNVRRASWIIVEYDEFDNAAEPAFVHQRRRFDGFNAQVLQHEIDHLSGVCILDRVSRQQRRHYERHYERCR